MKLFEKKVENFNGKKLIEFAKNRENNICDKFIMC